MSEYIKKEVAIELLKEIKTRVPDDLEMCVQVSIDVVTAIPAADVEPVVRGEWFLLDDCANAGVYCSVCTKSVFKESAWYKNVHLKSKRCPNCGAHMERSGSGEI